MIAICLLLCVGAFAKSAQVPFHTWLPDAMEGPTPVSALIHAATMVTAGVYLIARMFPLFELAPDGRRHRRLRRPRDAADRGDDRARGHRPEADHRLLDHEPDRLHDHGRLDRRLRGGMFMLMAHAFFKALLFMAAGSVISAMANNQNIDRMSGFRQARCRSPRRCCWSAAWRSPPSPAPPGFFSKDEILAFAADRGGMYWIFAIGGYIGAAADRLLRVPDRLPGRRRAAVRGGAGARAGPHRTTPSRPTRAPASPRTPTSASPGPSTTSPSASGRCRWRWRCSGFGALFGGLIQVPGVDHVVTTFLERHLRELAAVPHRALGRRLVARASRSAARSRCIGIAVAYFCYVRRPGVTVRLAERYRAPPRASCSTSGTSTRLIDALVYRPGDRDRPLRQRGLRALRRRRDRRRRDRRWSRAPARSSAAPSRASSAPTPCCWSAASPALGIYFLVVAN